MTTTLAATIESVFQATQAEAFFFGMRISVTPIGIVEERAPSEGHILENLGTTSVSLVPPHVVHIDPCSFYQSRNTTVQRLDVYGIDKHGTPIRVSKTTANTKKKKASGQYKHPPPTLLCSKSGDFPDSEFGLLVQHSQMTQHDVGEDNVVVSVFMRFMDLKPTIRCTLLEDVTRLLQSAIVDNQPTIVPITPMTLESLSHGISTVSWKYEKQKTSIYRECTKQFGFSPDGGHKTFEFLMEDSIWETARVKDLYMLTKHAKGAALPALVEFYLTHPNIRFMYVDTGNPANDQKSILTGLFGNVPANSVMMKTIRFKFGLGEGTAETNVYAAVTDSRGICTAATLKGKEGKNTVVWAMTVDNSPETQKALESGDNRSHTFSVLIAGHSSSRNFHITADNCSILSKEPFSEHRSTLLWNDPHVNRPVDIRVFPSTQLNGDDPALMSFMFQGLPLRAAVDGGGGKSDGGVVSEDTLFTVTRDPFKILKHWKMHKEMTRLRIEAEKSLKSLPLAERLHELTVQYQIPYNTFCTFGKSLGPVLGARSQTFLELPVDVDEATRQDLEHTFSHFVRFCNVVLPGELPSSFHHHSHSPYPSILRHSSDGTY